MEHRSETIGELLLSRLPRAANLGTYKDEVAALLAQNEKRLRQNRWTVVRVWIFVIVVSAPFLWIAGTHFNTAEGNWFLGLTGFWVLFGAIEVAKYVDHQGRVELLKELKQIELQILELNRSVSSSGARMSEKS